MTQARKRTTRDGGKYMYFELREREKGERKRKTQVWDVINKASEEPLGRISWYGPWRQYVFMPEPLTTFNDGCLNSISGFLGYLRQEHRGVG